ncbi:hypothetical protein GUJ93_ZPchr0013g36102 [Zizania palustris]|uniref:Uncharacterized protein n=1 Tax=Zizania palustris TaxID=103762 RepID=A0A8J5WYZ6_ZIZPA|nr:hypothetical protein GUJ93_ZPchr0013g36102 [Zizania palustris]
MLMDAGLGFEYKAKLLELQCPRHQEHDLEAGTFDCNLKAFPFTYLGLPLGTHKPKFRDLGSLMDKVERRLSHTTLWLSMAGKLQIVNSVFSALPTYAMCTFKLLIKVINHINRARRHCLWRGYNSGSTSHPRMAWKLVCKPKRKGGLGVVNLRTQNSALLKHIQKFFSSHDIPWVRLVWHHYHSLRIAPHLAPPKGSHWWKDVLQLSTFFRGIARPILGNSASAAFWEDCWHIGPLKIAFPRLFSFSKRSDCSVKSFLGQDHLEDNFNLPLSQDALQEFYLLRRHYGQHYSPTAHPGYLDLHLGVSRLLFQKILRSSIQESPVSCGFCLALEGKVLQQIKSLLLVTSFGQTAY